MNKYAEIIERLEKSTGPDQELDARIWAALAGVKYMRHNKPYGDQLGRTQVEYTEPPKRTRQVTNPPRMPHAEPVTASLDAALSLVRTHLPGEWIDIGGMTDSTEWECNIHTDYIEVQEHGLTPPLAVLKALFCALEAKETAG